MPIRVLEAGVAAKIAAGEVVERPAAAVKELVENAIDAGATNIAVELRGGGLELIRVVDDGCGIPADEVEVAFARHSTSKIGGVNDLERVSTLGFRGEALPSIAAVADIELTTRPAESSTATMLRLRGGRVVERNMVGTPLGTTITVRHLFQSIPARLKFLKTAAAEAGRVSYVISQLALAYPEIRFSLTIDGRPSLQSSGNGELRDVMLAVHGLEAARALIDVERTHESGIRVWGVVSLPSVTRANRNGLSLFVNRRWVQSRMLSHAIEEAYLELLPHGDRGRRHPIGAINIELPPAEVNVNVHPAKAEVKFRNDRIVYVAVQRAVREVIVREMPVPELTTDLRVPSVETQHHESQPPELGLAGAWPPMTPSPLAGSGSLFNAPVAGSDSAYRPKAGAGRQVPVLRVVGQLQSMFVLAEGPDGLYLIDQHTAHERILYERILVQQRSQAVESQGLLDPIPIEVTPEQDLVVRESLERLAAIGFEVEPFGERTYLLRTVPALLSNRDWRGGMVQVLDALGGANVGDDWIERAAATMACHSAIRAGEILTQDEMRELIRQLEEADLPYVCPHGRPVIVMLSTAQLEREFGRR